MRSGSKTGLSGLALIASIVGAAACSAGGSTTIIADGTGTTVPPPDGTTMMPPDPAKMDPSMMGDPTSKDTPPPPLASGLAITDVAVFQAVKVPVLTAGKVIAKASRNAPVVANRPALVRVYVKPGAGYKGGSVTAELRLVDGTKRLPVVQDTKTISAASTDADLQSTFNFEVPAQSLPPGVTYQVLLTSKDGAVPTGASDARFPTTGGVQDLDIEKSGKLKVVIVPVKYDYDGSGRTPDVSAAQLALYKSAFMARYPTSEVEVTARAPWSWTQRIAGTSSQGFSSVLQGVTQLRQSDQAPSDVYYYGAFAPTPSFNSFCGGGCITGLSTVVSNSTTSFLRASVGIGFTGEESAKTATHEVGHAHGREHAPCGGAQGVDPQFPYPNGDIGVWGYNILSKTLINPAQGNDMMGYCPNEWVSDYTYSALFDRILAVNVGAKATGAGSSGMVPAARTAQTYRMASVSGDGSVSWGGELALDEAPQAADTRAATFLSASGQEIGTHTAHFYPYDHLPGGVLVVPSAPQASTALGEKAAIMPTWTSVRIAGIAQPIAR